MAAVSLTWARYGLAVLALVLVLLTLVGVQMPAHAVWWAVGLLGLALLV